jgi:hypothetical protein
VKNRKAKAPTDLFTCAASSPGTFLMYSEKLLCSTPSSLSVLCVYNELRFNLFENIVGYFDFGDDALYLFPQS